MFSIIAVVVEVYVAVRVEHGVVQVEVHAYKLSVHPVGGEVEAVFVGAGSAAVVAVEGVEKPVVAVQPQVAVRAEAVEFGFRSGVGVGYMSFFLSHLRFVWFCKDKIFFLISTFVLIQKLSKKSRTLNHLSTSQAHASRVSVPATAPPTFCKNRLVGAGAGAGGGRGYMWRMCVAFIVFYRLKSI